MAAARWRRAGFIVGGSLIAVVGVLIGLYVSLYLEDGTPPAVAATQNGPQRASLTLQTVAQIGTGGTADWVSYFARNASGKWEHSTVLRVPAHSLIHVTVYQFDGSSGLRNPLWGQPRGIVRGTMYVNGKPLRVLNPDLTSHTFAIPELGVSVPLEGVADDAKNQCAIAPCTMDKAHMTITFTFRTGAPGKYRWQCFVPCAAGFIFGFGGPMQTIGYMDGELEVQ
jgi:hypothetical protein